MLLSSSTTKVRCRLLLNAAFPIRAYVAGSKNAALSRLCHHPTAATRIRNLEPRTHRRAPHLPRRGCRADGLYTCVPSGYGAQTTLQTRQLLPCGDVATLCWLRYAAATGQERCSRRGVPKQQQRRAPYCCNKVARFCEVKLSSTIESCIWFSEKARAVMTCRPHHFFAFF